jgi:hypothetical protein
MQGNPLHMSALILRNSVVVIDCVFLNGYACRRSKASGEYSF